MTTRSEEIQKRRIFGIISHPDAGKTTLTEKLLLHGGAIREAGTVKARRNSKFATSDWMEIEKQRGISVTSSVMQFAYAGKVISIMDTPGHNDFGEDTYRILTSVDSAVMVIDGAKGIEAQTKKLFKVCSMRGIPIFTFINKLDRETKEPFDLVQELEDVLGLPSVPVSWPIGNGMNFEGIYDLLKNEVHLYKSGKQTKTLTLGPDGVFGPELENEIAGYNLSALRDEIELIQGAGNEFDMELVSKGKLSPVFFGSALADFGTIPFLEHFLDMSPAPGPRKTTTGEVQPTDDFFSGFIFKIQANMNKNHRDRIAFLRICSGKFERGMEAFHVQEGKNIKLATGTSLMADDRAIVSEAYAGDIIGLFDPGIFSIGDTLCTGKKHVQFAGIPTFAPEHFARVTQVDTMKRKQFVKGMEQIAQEGAIQIFRDLGAGMEEVIVGVVGVLQLEVLEYRLKNEYNVDIRMQTLPYEHLRWVLNDPEELDIKHLDVTSDTRAIEDMKGNPLLLFGSPWSINWAEQHNEALKLSEFGNLTF